MDDGWIKLHRSALDCDQFKDDWLWRLWCWCLLKANHTEGNFKGTVVPRGSFITGKLRAAEELGVTESKWWRGVDRLSKPPYSCLHASANNRWTMITVMEYETYQQTAIVLLPSANNKRTTSEQPTKPIEEQQEQKELQVGRGAHVPAVFNSPAISGAMDRFAEYFRQRYPGEYFDAFMRQETYEHALREAWTPEAFLVNVSESIKAGWRGVYAKREVPGRSSTTKPRRGEFAKSRYDT